MKFKNQSTHPFWAAVLIGNKGLQNGQKFRTSICMSFFQATRSSRPLTGSQAPLAGPQAPLAGPQTPLAGPLTLLTGPQDPLAGPQSPLACPQNPLVGAQTSPASPQTPPTSPQTCCMDSRKADVQTDIRNFSPFYRTLSPCWGCCPATL